MSADETHRTKFRCQGPKFTVVGEVEVENDYLGTVPMNDVPNLVDIASDADVTKIGVELSREMLSDDAVGLSDYDVMVVHVSLSYNAPQWAANVAFEDELRTPKSLALGTNRTARGPTARITYRLAESAAASKGSA